MSRDASLKCVSVWLFNYHGNFVFFPGSLVWNAFYTVENPFFFSLPASPPKYMNCTGVFVFFFFKSGGRNDAKYAFQYTFKNNTTQFAKKKEKKRKNKVCTFTMIFEVGASYSS